MKNKIIANVINAVLVSFVVTALVCFLLVQFADIPFLPTWDSLFRSNPEFDTVSDSVIFMNVGEGDSTLIRSNGRFVLIDTGDGDSVDIVRKLNDFGVTGLDALVLTHWHDDHIGGSKEIMEKFPVLNVVAPALPDKNGDIYENAISVYESVREQKIDFTFIQQGMAINVGDFRLSVVYCNTENSEENNRSAIIIGRCRDSEFLFMADAEKSLEQEILDRGITVDCDVIKIGHHGSKTSSSDDFIDAVTPEFAVISVGAGNGYGHPSSAVLNRLYNKNIEVYRTDKMGDIKFFVDEDYVRVEEAS